MCSYAVGSIIVSKERAPLVAGLGALVSATSLLALRAPGGVSFAIPLAATRWASVLRRRLVGFVTFGLMFAQHDLSVAVNRKGLQHHVETLAVLVWKRHADIEPIVVMFRSLDDRVDPIHLRHVGNSLCYVSMSCECRSETHTRVARL